MLSDQQRWTALKKNIAHARDMARWLLADGVKEITLTYYADEGSFRAMRLPEEGRLPDKPDYHVLVWQDAEQVSSRARGRWVKPERVRSGYYGQLWALCRGAPYDRNEQLT